MGNDGSTSAFGPTPGKKQHVLSITPKATTNTQEAPNTAQLVADTDSLLAQLEGEGDENAHRGMAKVPKIDLEENDEEPSECNTQ